VNFSPTQNNDPGCIWPETGFETINLQLNDHADRGVGGRQYGTSEDIETLQGQNNTSATRLGAVEECGSSLACSGQFARIIRPCHRRIGSPPAKWHNRAQVRRKSEQIQFLLGHASVQTTERHLGCKQNLSQAVNENLGLEDT
jgi:hypothetical protein